MSGNNTTVHRASVTRARRERQNGHRSVIVWLTGLSGSGKSTLAHAVEEQLHRQGCRTFVLDGDNVRQGLCRDLGFSEAAREENIRRVGEVAKLCLEAGSVVLSAFISPFERDRARVRALVAPGDFLEVYCACPLPVCEARDVKDLYRRARAGEIADFTGISSPYEAPQTPELVIDTASLSLEQSVARILDLLRARGVIDDAPPAAAGAASSLP